MKGVKRLPGRTPETITPASVNCSLHSQRMLTKACLFDLASRDGHSLLASSASRCKPQSFSSADSFLISSEQAVSVRRVWACWRVGGSPLPLGPILRAACRVGFVLQSFPWHDVFIFFSAMKIGKLHKKKKKKDSLFIYFSIIFSTLPRGITFTVARLNEFALFVTCRWVPWTQFVVHPMDSCTDDAEMERPYAISCFLGSVWIRSPQLFFLSVPLYAPSHAGAWNKLAKN